MPLRPPCERIRGQSTKERGVYSATPGLARHCFSMAGASVVGSAAWAQRGFGGSARPRRWFGHPHAVPAPCAAKAPARPSRASGDFGATLPPGGKVTRRTWPRGRPIHGAACYPPPWAPSGIRLERFAVAAPQPAFGSVDQTCANLSEATVGIRYGAPNGWVMARAGAWSVLASGCLRLSVVAVGTVRGWGQGAAGRALLKRCGLGGAGGSGGWFRWVRGGSAAVLRGPVDFWADLRLVLRASPGGR